MFFSKIHLHKIIFNLVNALLFCLLIFFSFFSTVNAVTKNHIQPKKKLHHSIVKKHISTRHSHNRHAHSRKNRQPIRRTHLTKSNNNVASDITISYGGDKLIAKPKNFLATNSTIQPTTVFLKNPTEIPHKTEEEQPRNLSMALAHFFNSSSQTHDVVKNATPEYTATKQVENKEKSHTPWFAAAFQKHLVNFIHKTVSTLRYSDYKLGGRKFDTSRGIYIVDCSNFVDRVLERASPRAYLSLVNATGADNPATQHYYEFFHELSRGTDNFWNKIDAVNQLRAGDILVFRYKNSRGAETGGHVMVVMDKPIQDNDIFFVRIADSAPSRHSQDTRHRNEAGIGIGTLLLKINPRTGRPSAYAWGLGGIWNRNVNFAMARPLDNSSFG